MDESHSIRHRLEFLAVRGLVALLGSLPAAPGRATGRTLAKAFRLIQPYRSRIAAENLRSAFPEAGDGQISAWVKETWENLGETLWEFSRIALGGRPAFDELVEVRGLDGFKKSFSQGKGLLLFTAHYCNWEMISFATAATGLPLAFIARRMKNALVNDFITGIRSQFGGRVLMHKNAVRESIKFLKQGKVLGLLFDQRITDGGILSPFLGKPAHTTTLPALLAIRLGVPVHGAVSWREKGKVVLEYGPAMKFSHLEPNEENIRKVTDELNDVVTGWIRRWPPGWLWIHNRWKP